MSQLQIPESVANELFQWERIAHGFGIDIDPGMREFANMRVTWALMRMGTVDHSGNEARRRARALAGQPNSMSSQQSASDSSNSSSHGGTGTSRRRPISYQGLR